MKRKPIIIALIAALCLSCAATLLWQPPPLDLSNDEEPFSSMLLPPKNVSGDMYMDGGSISVHVIDLAGTHFEFTFPIDSSKVDNPYPTAYCGNLNDPTMVPLKNPERAKQIAIFLLGNHGNKVPSPNDSDDCDGTRIACRALSNPVHAKVFRIVDKMKNFF